MPPPTGFNPEDHDCFDGSPMESFRTPQYFYDCRGRDYPVTWFIGQILIGSLYYNAYSTDLGMTWTLSKSRGTGSTGIDNSSVIGCIGDFRVVGLQRYYDTELEGSESYETASNLVYDYPQPLYDGTFLTYQVGVGGPTIKKSSQLQQGTRWNDTVTTNVTVTSAAASFCPRMASNGFLYVAGITGSSSNGKPSMSISGDYGRNWATLELGISTIGGGSPWTLWSATNWEKSGTYYYHCSYSIPIGFDPFIAYSTRYATSPDGITWTSVAGSTNTFQLPMGRVFNLTGGRIVAIPYTASSSIISYSDDDGLTWTGDNASGTALATFIDPSKTLYRLRLIGSQLYIYCSTDASSWSLYSTLPAWLVTTAQQFISTNQLITDL